MFLRYLFVRLLFSFKRMETCYRPRPNKCMKSFFKCRKFDSLTVMLSKLGLSYFNVLFNDSVSKRLSAVVNTE